jgi:hypothetical protein
MIEISESEFLEHSDSNDGICLNCEEWTCGGVEPDATNYLCRLCGTRSVVGCEHALIIEAIGW